MLIDLKWTVTRSENGHPTEYYAQLPSGAIVYVRSHDHAWIAVVQLRGEPDQTATFATAYDAQMVVAGDEVQRLIELGARAAALHRERRVERSTSDRINANVFRGVRA